MGFFSWLFGKKQKKMFDADQYRKMVQRAEKAGHVNGRHYTTYVEEVENLKRANKHGEAISLLLQLVYAAESQHHIDKYNIPPWYYEQLSILYRKEKEYAKEVSILQRYLALKDTSGGKSAKMTARLEKAKQLMQSQDK